MKIDGSCHCGCISYEAEIDPEQVGICHCTDCQTLSGSAFRTIVLVPAEKLAVSGQPKVYVKTAASGKERAQAFCAECGSPIYSTSVGEESKIYSIRLGTVLQRRDLPPRFQIWSRSAQQWLSGVSSVPSKERQ